MQITVNGEPREIDHDILRAVLIELGYRATGVAVEVNGTILSVQDYESTIIHAADRLEIVCFVGGG